MFTYTFLAFFVAFHQKVCVFIIFISFLDKISNFKSNKRIYKVRCENLKLTDFIATYMQLKFIGI